MSAASIPDLKRIEFFSGQRLTAQDLTDLQSANRELRWLHNRSLHGWGIGTGYAVVGEAGDTAVTIAPGYAVDCVGRELILTEPVTMPVPAVAGDSAGGKVVPATFYLTISYLGDTGQSTVESRPGVCLPGGTVRLTEGPLIQWQRFADVRDGLNVILAEASVLNCQLNAPLGLDVRRPARPPQQPYINAGQVPPAAITWTQIPFGIQAHVDTSPAQFGATPAYFMHVMGPRIVFVPSPVGKSYFLVAVPIVGNPTPAGFNCDVLLLQISDVGTVVAVDAADIPALIPELKWTIVWMGIEG
jgi:hypothetical protein